MNVFDGLFLILFYLKLTGQSNASWVVVWGSLAIALIIRSAAIRSAEKKEEKLNEVRKNRRIR